MKELPVARIAHTALFFATLVGCGNRPIAQADARQDGCIPSEELTGEYRGTARYEGNAPLLSLSLQVTSAGSLVRFTGAFGQGVPDIPQTNFNGHISCTGAMVGTLSSPPTGKFEGQVVRDTSGVSMSGYFVATYPTFTLRRVWNAR